MAEINDTAPAKTLQLSKDKTYNLQYQVCELQSIARAALLLLDDEMSTMEHTQTVDAKYLLSVLVDRAQIVWDQFDSNRMYVVELPKD